MDTIYTTLVFIHVFAAIIGLGPGFTFTFIVRSAQTMSQLKFAYKINHMLHNFVMVGGVLLIVSGLLMGMMNHALFHQGWYVTALILFLIALASGPILLSPKSKPIKAFLAAYEGGEEIPEEYHRLAKKAAPFDMLANIIFILIIVLMILKPF